MSEISNCYEILECQEGTSIDEIRRKYKQLALKYHPDKNHESSEVFEKIARAYKVLEGEETRKQHDASLKNQRINDDKCHDIVKISEFVYDGNRYLRTCRCGENIELYSEDIVDLNESDLSIECDTCSNVIILRS